MSGISGSNLIIPKPPFTPVAGSWTDVDADLTFGTGTMDATGEGAGRVVTGNQFAGDFNVTGVVTSETNWGFGVYDIAENATYANNSNIGNMSGMTKSWFYSGGDDSIKYGGAAQDTGVTWSASDTWGIKRVGTTFSIQKNGSTIWTFSQTDSVEVRLVIGSGGGVTNIDDISWLA